MYIFELITKLLKNKKQKHYINKTSDENQAEECKHVFLPLDSTNETLACTKCGMIIKNDSITIKSKNPFLD